MFKKNKTLFLIGGLISIIFLIILIRIFTLSQSSSPAVSPTPLNTTINTPYPTVEPNQTTQPAYNINQTDKDYQRIISKKQLSASNQAIRDKLISSLNSQSGILQNSLDFQISYVKSPNVFMVEIKTNNADNAKQEAENWFTNQGLDQDGICNLPVVFYLSPDVDDYFKQHNLQFNPVPDGC